MSAKLRRAVGEARDRLHGRLSARRAVAGAAVAAAPAAAFAVAAWTGGPSWLAALAVAAGAAGGAAWGALTKVTMTEAAVALDRATGAGDRLATAWEVAGRKDKSELSTRVVADGVASIKPVAFPWTFRRRDALAALGAAAIALFALAAPAEATSGRDEERMRLVGQERERLAKTAAEAEAALAKSGSKEAADAVKAAKELAGAAGADDPKKAAADFSRCEAQLRAMAAEAKATNPAAARELERMADRLAAGAARLNEAATPGAAAASAKAPPGAGAGHGPLDNPRALPDTAIPAFSAVSPADPVALQMPTWPAEYDAAVTHYFSEERK